MEKEIEEKINGGEREVKLNGKIALNVNKSGSIAVGRACVKGIIEVRRDNVVIDGENAEIEVNVEDCTTGDWCLFYVHSTARDVEFKNMCIRVKIQNPADCMRTLSVIYNAAFGLKLNNVHIEMFSDKQLNMVCVYNNGNLDTHMETRADNLVIQNCTLKAHCRAEEHRFKTAVYGLYNNLANSISVQNTFIYATNSGDGDIQNAVGIYTNGRFGRFVGNNIKANASHNIGLEKEQAHAFGFVNEGLYSIITSNNVVGEWAGMSVGLENRGEYAVVSGNKILATHTICGRSVRNYADNALIEGNVLTSTSRNARLLEQAAANCVIGRNVMEVLMVESECVSGCGIYAASEKNLNNIISENVIKNVKDCGIFALKTAGVMKDNIVFSYERTVNFAAPDNAAIKNILDESRIQSIYR